MVCFMIWIVLLSNKKEEDLLPFYPGVNQTPSHLTLGHKLGRMCMLIVLKIPSSLGNEKSRPNRPLPRLNYKIIKWYTHKQNIYSLCGYGVHTHLDICQGYEVLALCTDSLCVFFGRRLDHMCRYPCAMKVILYQNCSLIAVIKNNNNWPVSYE